MVSIVIPAYNEEKTIGDCLESLTKQVTKQKFEVIVVDNNSSDKTSGIVKKYSKKLTLKCILEKKKGAGVARARGFDEAKSDIILTTDADTILPPDWINTLVRPFSDKKIVAVTTLCQIDEPSRIKRAIFMGSVMTSIVGFRLINGHYWLSGYSFAVRRDAYERAGKINTALPYLDDLELSFRIHKQGKILFIKDKFVYSSSRRFKGGIIKGLTSYIKPSLQVMLLKKHTISMEDVR